MARAYRIFGSELSPYSVKVRSYFRYKGIAHEWTPRGPANQAEFQKYARLPLVPLVVTPEDEGIQDSTPIIERLEASFAEPSIHPPDPALAFLSALLEEFGDEWGNKWMFHYRWRREADQRSAAERLAAGMLPADAGPEQRDPAARAIRERMISRVGFVGSSDLTAAQIESSFVGALDILEVHLGSRPYLFGGRPAFADFGLWGQIYNASTDPTPGEILRKRAPAVMAWVQRMLEPKIEAEFEPWAALGATLHPLLEQQVGALFLPWSCANALALDAGEKELNVELGGKPWRQRPQRYHAKSLAALRARYASVPDRSDLDPILERANCLRWLDPIDC